MNEAHTREVSRQLGGWKTPVFLVLLLLLVGVGMLVYHALPPGEPRYGGKRLSFWLKQYQDAAWAPGMPSDPKVDESKQAIQQIGTNGIPTLLRMLRAKNSTLKLKLMELLERHDMNDLLSDAEDLNAMARIGLSNLGDKAANAIPAVVAIYQSPPSAVSKHEADAILKAIYPVSSNAIPHWIPRNMLARWCSEAGTVKYEYGAYSNAILAYTEAINLDPNDATHYSSRATAEIFIRDLKGGLEDSERAIAMDGSNESAYYTRGWCHLAMRDFKSAEADMTKAIDLDTNNVPAYDGRGLARTGLQKLDDALADFNKAISISPSEPGAYLNRAYTEGIQKEYEAALADISKSMSLNSKGAAVYIVRGQVECALKDYKSARADFGHAVELAPGNSDAYAARASVCIFEDDFQNGEADLQRALQINPNNSTAYLYRGILKAKMGREGEEALADLQHAVDLAPQSSQTRGLLGLFQYKYSQWTPALQNCRKALEMGTVTSANEFRSYAWLIEAQTGHEHEANRGFEDYLKTLQGSKTNEWDASIARFFVGDLTESNFLEEAMTKAKRPSDATNQICESFYYAGMKRKLAGDKEGAAGLFKKCVDTRNENSMSYMNAQEELHRTKTN